jgi:hypothetical protein
VHRGTRHEARGTVDYGLRTTDYGLLPCCVLSRSRGPPGAGGVPGACGCTWDMGGERCAWAWCGGLGLRVVWLVTCGRGTVSCGRQRQGGDPFGSRGTTSSGAFDIKPSSPGADRSLPPWWALGAGSSSSSRQRAAGWLCAARSRPLFHGALSSHSLSAHSPRVCV